MTVPYKSTLSAGQGMIPESRILLELWQPSMDGKELHRAALASGRFATVSAKRLSNMVIDVFTPRFLTCERPPVAWLKDVQDQLSARELAQIMFLYAARDNLVLADFVRQVYWPAYAAGRDTISNEDARRFVERANLEGKPRQPWSDTVVTRMARYLTGACADFALLENGRANERRILPFRIEPRVAAILAYDLHFEGLGDNRVLAHEDWLLFGLEREDVLAEFKRLALRGLFIIQAAGEVVKIHWPYKSMDEVLHVLTQGEF
ncbi:MAG: BrxA family protein [Caldilineaceae bacterium]